MCSFLENGSFELVKYLFQSNKKNCLLELFFFKKWNIDHAMHFGQLAILILSEGIKIFLATKIKRKNQGHRNVAWLISHIWPVPENCHVL
jgi:hypothetical protein